jgi:hypothetical protein
VAQVISLPECIYAEEHSPCRLRDRRALDLAEEAEAASVTIQWRWVESGKINARIGIEREAPFDLCRCLTRHACLRIMQAVRADEDVVSELARLLAFALGNSVHVTVEVQSPARPSWLPAGLARQVRVGV